MDIKAIAEQHVNEYKAVSAQILEIDEQRKKLADRRSELQAILATLQFVEQQAKAADQPPA